MGTDHLFKGNSLHSMDPLNIREGRASQPDSQVGTAWDAKQSELGSRRRWGAVELAL